MNLPSHCAHCHVPLMGGATRHKRDCPFYPLTVQGIEEQLREVGLTPIVKLSMEQLAARERKDGYYRLVGVKDIGGIDEGDDIKWCRWSQELEGMKVMVPGEPIVVESEVVYVKLA